LIFHSFQFKNGIDCFNSGNFDKAFEHFTEALQMNSDLVEAMEKRAKIHFKREEYDECVIECDEILSRKSSPSITKLKSDAIKKRSSDESWWQVFNVARTATKAQVNKIYSQLAKKFHPDRKKGLKVDKDKYTAKMAKINSAKQEFEKSI
jgi:Tfp pilus assembly protein PilF